MKALCYADIQAANGNEQCHQNPSIPLQQWRVQKFFKLLHAVYKKYKCDCVWDLGDTTDDRNAIPLPVIDTVIAGIEQFPQSDWNIKLVGNHEQYVRNTKIHVGKLFSSRFQIVPDYDSFESDSVRLVCCSYPQNERALTEWLHTQRKGNPAILLGHFQVVGAQQNSGQALTGIEKKTIDWVGLGLLGHIHKPQQICGNIHYVGSPFQQHWGEAGEDKRIAIVDTAKLQVSWIPMTGFPVYREVSFKEFAEIYESKTEQEDRLRVILRDPGESAQFYKHPSAHQVVPVYEYDPVSESKQGNGEDTGSWDRGSILKRYLERHPPNETNIPVSADDMLEFGLHIAEGGQ